MRTANITIKVDESAARAFAEASPREQQELTATEGKSLQAVMDVIGSAAEARGLTPEILETLLRDE